MIEKYSLWLSGLFVMRTLFIFVCPYLSGVINFSMIIFLFIHLLVYLFKCLTHFNLMGTVNQSFQNRSK